MQVPILSGIIADSGGDFRTTYPVNLVPVPKPQGLSSGYLRPAPGLIPFSAGAGVDRGGIEWRGMLYRVMGSQLCRINADGTVDLLGSVGAGGYCRFDYSFDRLAIASGGNLYYWDGSTLTLVTDVDLSTVLSMVWVDGYFMTTDGEFLVVTELTDPTQISPLKYGSSETDPDDVKCLLKLRGEVYALNRNTIEVFQNVGGDNFPFARVDGAKIMRGTLGAHTACLYMDAIAFLGGGRNEAISVWMGANSQAAKISTREIDTLLEGYTEAQLSDAVMESQVWRSHTNLLIHLPDQTLVYDGAASQLVGQHIWHVRSSGSTGLAQYKARGFVRVYDRWVAGDPTSSRTCTLSDEVSSHYGDAVQWSFGTAIVYNQGAGALFREIELVCLSGHVAQGIDPLIHTQYSEDGETWSQVRTARAGRQGHRAKRIVWIQQGAMQHWRMQRFTGTSDSHLTIARLEAQIEPLMH